MTEPNELSSSDVPAPPPFDGLEERCAAIPWEVRGRNVYGGFWRTVLMVLAHPSRLGELIDQPVSPKEAKDFRRTVVLFFVPAMIVSGVVEAVLLFRQNGNTGVPILTIFIGIPVGLLFSWVLVRFVIGASRWFFCPPHLGPRRQESSLALSYYLTSPLALAALAWLALPLVAINHPLAAIVSTLLASVPPLAALVWYYVLVVIGLRRIARRQDRNLAFSAIGVAMIWLTIWAGMFLVPLCAAMWLLMYGSLS
jgi:hypothetical protein